MRRRTSMSFAVAARLLPALRLVRGVLLAGVAAAALSACATSRPGGSEAGLRGEPPPLAQLEARYKADPRDKRTILTFAAALRAANEPEQAVSVLEAGLTIHRTDVDIRIAYAKALAAAGQFARGLNVINDAINPAAPDWTALLVKGAILDQSGRNEEARAAYSQALLTAPNESSLEANLGLSYAMTNELDKAETHLRRAAGMRGATSQTRQNLALVIGLQGRLEESEALFAAELPPEQVATNMAYIRTLLKQQNRWDMIRNGG